MVDDLLKRPIWQMTGAEFLSLLQSSIKSSEDKAPIVSEEREKVKRYEYGIRGIAKIFGCSIPTANRIKKSGKINAAITQIGRKIIVDADLALQLAKNIKTM